MAKFHPLQFARDVRSEADKITWPTRKETMVTSMMVFIMVAFCSVFFLIADEIILWLVRSIIRFGS